MARQKHYDYYCIARTGGAFAIVDFKNMQWCFMYRADVKANKSKIMFSDKKETYMRRLPYLYDGNSSCFVNPSTYFTKDGEYSYPYHFKQIRNNVTNRSEDLWAVPYDVFLEACGTDSDLLTLMLVYGTETMYDKVITTFLNQYYVSNWGVWQPL